MGKKEAKPVPRAAAATPPPQWLALSYAPVAPFSLRPSAATSAGGKTLLLPTPYAIKLALVDATMRSEGTAAGETLFEDLKHTAVGLLPAEHACVTNTFARSLKKTRGAQQGPQEADDDDEEDGSEDGGWPFSGTLLYREICVLSGPLTVALGLREGRLREPFERAARRVNYFGKRGGFFQLLRTDVIGWLDPRTVVVDPLGWEPEVTFVGDVACVLDDLGSGATLDAVNPFSSASAAWGRDRVAQTRLLPLRRLATGSHFTAYERLPADEK